MKKMGVIARYFKVFGKKRAEEVAKAWTDRQNDLNTKFSKAVARIMPEEGGELALLNKQVESFAKAQGFSDPEKNAFVNAVVGYRSGRE